MEEVKKLIKSNSLKSILKNYALFKRILFKSKNQHKHAIYFKKLVHSKRLLHKLHMLLQHLNQSSTTTTTTTTTPTNKLISLSLSQDILLNLIISLEKSYIYIKRTLIFGHFLPFCLILSGVLACLWVNCKEFLSEVVLVVDLLSSKEGKECGSERDLRVRNIKFREFLRGCGLGVDYEETRDKNEIEIKHDDLLARFEEQETRVNIKNFDVAIFSEPENLSQTEVSYQSKICNLSLMPPKMVEFQEQETQIKKAEDFEESLLLFQSGVPSSNPVVKLPPLMPPKTKRKQENIEKKKKKQKIDDIDKIFSFLD